MEKIFTERAHLMCPRMNFGIAVCIDHLFDENRIRSSFEKLAANHPFLKAVLGYEDRDNSYIYDVTDTSKIDLKFSEVALTGVDDPALLKEYESLTGYDWDIRKEGLLKAVAFCMNDKAVFLLIFHHLLADGRGAVNLAKELADIYTGADDHACCEERLISSADDLPKESGLPFISRLLVNKANRDWEREGHEPLSYSEYHKYADSFVKKDKLDISLNTTSADEVGKMLNECRDNGVTVNDLLMSKMYREDGTDKIIIARDLRDSFPFYIEGALGNYSTAFSVVIRKKDKDILTLAKEVHEKVKKTIANPRKLYLVLQCYAALKHEVLDAAFMAAKGAFESKSAEFIGKMFFGFESPKGYSITNLGRIESENIVSAYFIPPASPAIKKTVGVLTVNNVMITCTCERS